MKTLGTLLCTGMMVWAAPALAGFEFTPRAPEPARQAPVALEAPESAVYEPMPIIPAEPVSAEPLAPLVPPPAADPVISEAVSRADEEQVYVRRQRAGEASSKVIKSQPMEAEALLTATANKELVQPERLVINPYPLEGAAIHGGDGGRTGVEQAMMEESGMLRPVKTPGSSRAGLVARARPAMAQPLKKENDFGDEVLVSSNMTPFPGEKANVADIEAEPVSMMPTPAKLRPEEKVAVPPTNVSPRGTSETSANAGFTEAVGFGRDLPLALALSQVVPAEYSYSFARNVNVGTTVSWQGGKPWNQVLDEMLAQSGMKADIEDGQVTIHNAS